MGKNSFIYIIILVPIFVLWNGIVSSTRTYSVQENDELIGGLDKKENLNRETGRIQSGSGSILYLSGITKNLKNV